MKQILLIAIMIAFTSCAFDYGNNYTSMDRVYKCMIRLIERNGISPQDARKVCTNTFLRQMDNIGVHKQ